MIGRANDFEHRLERFTVARRLQLLQQLSLRHGPGFRLADAIGAVLGVLILEGLARHERERFLRIRADETGERFDSGFCRERVKRFALMREEFSVHRGVDAVDVSFENDVVGDAHAIICLKLISSPLEGEDERVPIHRARPR